jgi:YggT family protein
MLAIIADLLEFYLVILFGRVVLSWFPLSPDGPMAAVARFFYALTEPVLAPLRSILPPMRMGGMGLDLSPMIVFFAILVILRLIQ